jgi:hypothetical protein
LWDKGPRSPEEIAAQNVRVRLARCHMLGVGWEQAARAACRLFGVEIE